MKAGDILLYRDPGRELRPPRDDRPADCLEQVSFGPGFGPLLGLRTDQLHSSTHEMIASQ